jgi:hypothetical protein
MGRQVLFGSEVNTVYDDWVGFNSSDQFDLGIWLGSSNVVTVTTTAVFRDPAAWYHVVVAVDTTQAVAANRATIYVNGVQQSTTLTNTIPQNYDIKFLAGTNPTYIGGQYRTDGLTFYFDGYIAEANYINGQALSASSFGSINPQTGVWAPKKYTGTYGTNGFYLNFADNSAATAAAIGKDSSGNGNNWTPNNISLTSGYTYDSMIDVPTPYADGGTGRGNYATLNPLFINAEVSANVYEGNLSIFNSTTTNGVGGQKISSILVSSGKWYVEVYMINGGSNYQYLGVQTTRGDIYAILGICTIYNSGVIQGSSGSQTGVGFCTNGDTIGIALDADAGIVKFYKNNVQLGSNQSIATGVELGIMCSAYYSNGPCSMHPNFGQRPFAYTPPAGFLALNTQNLPVPSIKNPALYMAATTYTGTGANCSVSNLTNNKSFQPDLVWIKGRSGATDHALYDSVRGAQKDLVSNSTAAETTQSTGLTLFATDGFSVGSLAKVNTNAATYVAWQWKAGDSVVSNTAGTITSQVNANPTTGLSIVTYTGTGANATVGHGLGAAPKMIIIKNKSAVADWQVYHSDLTSAAYAIQLDLTSAQASTPTAFNSTAPTSSVFSVGTAASTNGSTNSMLAYVFAEVPGYSKFGSYTGNGSADGPFVYCGFRPKFILFKNASVAADWQIYDSARDAYNEAFKIISPDGSYTEDTASATRTSIDILSNGFKIRRQWTCTNNSGQNYIFAAFAETPSKYALAR